MGQFERTELLLGKDSLEILRQSRVAVFGVGGVGGYTVEALARSGIGTLDLIDDDRVALSNLNRQIIALHSTVGKYKVDVARDRVLDINPDAQVNVYRTFYLPETSAQFDFSVYDYVVDAIDTVSGKLQLVEQSVKAGTPVISSMGAGNKLNPAAFEVADISETSVCPLAKVMRRELKKRGIAHLKVVYSREKPLTPVKCEESDGKEVSEKKTETEENRQTARRRQTPGSVSFVPSVAGLILAGEVIRDLIAAGMQ
ncbi:MAG: tRNA threonylcarbamoyladenosine dehydratase [Candidatus Choladocola sp.]|nr:tRNA threonylcarbamoyladenosine dehydratase [Candidatus Choladocola sp.]